MESTLLQILTLLVEPPGNLIYHLVLVFATLAALQAVSLLEKPENHALAIRMRVGLFIILSAQVFLFGLSALGWQNLIDTRIVLPPLDRAVIAATLLWLGWMITFPEKNKIADWTVVLLTLAIAGYFVYSLFSWSEVVGQTHFNNTSLEFTWATIFLAISVFCAILIVYFRPEGWGTGLGIYIVVFLGSILHLSMPTLESDYAGALRLALICVFPLLPGLARSLKRVPSAGPAKVRRPTQPRRFDFRAVQAWSQLAGLTDRQEAAAAWIKALGYSVDADRCALIASVKAEGTINVQHGWDLSRQQRFSSPALPMDSLPIVYNAFRSGKSICLPATAEDEDVRDKTSLAALLGVDWQAHYLAVPIAVTETGWSGIITAVAAPRRLWTQDDADALQKIVNETLKFLNQLPSKHISEQDIQQLDKLLDKTQKEVLDLREERRLLLDELDEMRVERDASDMKVNLDSLMAVQREMQETINALEAENETLRKKLGETSKPQMTEEARYLEQELRSSLEETAHLQNALAEASITIMNLQQRSGQGGVFTEDARHSLIKNIQKMYSPISLVVAYTNLLLSDTSGSIGPLHQNFLDRIHLSAEKLKAIMDDLVRTAGQTASPIELAQQFVDFDEIVDQVVGDISPILNSKNITLQRSIPEDLPLVYADRDALQQIIVHMLQNAVTVTPANGTIEFHAEIENLEDEENYLVFKIIDEGGGIPVDEIGKVFNKEYRFDHPAIRGISDSGTGLTITQALIEAHNGRIWAESNQPGKSTFTIILPLENQPADGISQAI